MRERERRVVVVSNRVPPAPKEGQPQPAGGLVSALLPALAAHGGLWFGWSGRTGEPHRPPRREVTEAIDYVHIDLTEAEVADYYEGFCNRTLWPRLHGLAEQAASLPREYWTYRSANRRFALALFPLLLPDDAVWVHDYHLIAFGEELRRMGARQTMGFFLHIPFPSPEVLVALPVHDLLVRALFAYDVLGFQTETDRRGFLEYVTNEAGGSVDGGSARAFGRRVDTGVFPIGIDAVEFARLATSAVDDEVGTHAKRMARVLRDRLLVIGVDRLDYTKGLPERFRAVARFLEMYPEDRGRVSFVQIAPPSRADVPEYVDIRHELEGLSGSINAEYSEFDWTPLRYINRNFSRRALAEIFRLARVGLVTPLRDGMNLVAKEYVAAQPAHDPGVLMLSRFAGAARQGAEGALIVNPYDVQGVADALHSALGMPLAEREERWRTLMEGVRRNNVTVWRESFVAHLRDAQRAKRRH